MFGAGAAAVANAAAAARPDQVARSTVSFLRDIAGSIERNEWVDFRALGCLQVGFGLNHIEPVVVYIFEWIGIYGHMTGTYPLERFVADPDKNEEETGAPVYCAETLLRLCGYSVVGEFKRLGELLPRATRADGPGVESQVKQGFQHIVEDHVEVRVQTLVPPGGDNTVYAVPPGVYAVVQNALLLTNTPERRVEFLGEIMERVGYDFPGGRWGDYGTRVAAARWLTTKYGVYPDAKRVQRPLRDSRQYDGNNVGGYAFPCIPMVTWARIEAWDKYITERRRATQLQANAGVSVDQLSALKMDAKMAKEAYQLLKDRTEAEMRAERDALMRRQNRNEMKIAELEVAVREKTARAEALSEIVASLRETMALVAAAGGAAPVAAGGAAILMPAGADLTMRQANCSTVCDLYLPVSKVLVLPDRIPLWIQQAQHDALSVCEYVFFSTPQLWLMFWDTPLNTELIRLMTPGGQLDRPCRAMVEVVNSRARAGSIDVARGLFPMLADDVAWQQRFRDSHITAPILSEIHVGLPPAGVVGPGGAHHGAPGWQLVGHFHPTQGRHMNAVAYGDNGALIAVPYAPPVPGDGIYARTRRVTAERMPYFGQPPGINWVPA
jgi:hypothetical protein